MLYVQDNVVITEQETIIILCQYHQFEINVYIHHENDEITKEQCSRGKGTSWSVRKQMNLFCWRTNMLL